VKRPVGYGAVVLGAVAGVVGAVLGQVTVTDATFRIDGGQVAAQALLRKALFVVAIALLAYGVYLLVSRALSKVDENRRRVHDVRNLLRLLFVIAAVVGILGVVTEQWVGLLFSLGVVGFAVTFALQQPLFSVLGWIYIMLKRPYEVGDRVKVGDAKGDVVEVDFFVTTLYEVEGDLVSSHQPSGRVVTLPNSTVLSAEVYNYSRREFPYVWNDLTVQVAYETDLAFAREAMADVADDYLGDEMAENVGRYRERLRNTPVDVDVNDRPTVNIHQQESWVELRLRYLTDPRSMQATRNELYERIFARFAETPDRVSYPVGRFR